jgi:hypothetical protein
MAAGRGARAERSLMLAVLVLDALNQPLLERMLDEGRLPAIAGLREANGKIPLAGQADYLESSIHTTLHTGLEVSGHGIYSPFQWSAPDQRVRTRDAFEVPRAIWDRLSRAGRRSLLIDPYDCVPPVDLLGDGVRGWQYTNRVALPPWSTGSTRRTLARRFGRPRRGDEIYGRPTPQELLALREVMLDGPRRVADAAEELLAREHYDFLWIDFASMHTAGHQFLDVDAVAHTEGMDPAGLARLHTALEDSYLEGDAAIARVLEALPEGADVIVAATSTMVEETDRQDMLPAMLAAVFGGAEEGAAEPGRLQLWRIRSSVPRSARTRMAGLVPDRIALGLTARMSVAGLDWSRTRAFAVPNDPGGGIRVNLRGRERKGIVEPSEAEEVIEEVIAGLETFTDPDGAPAIEDIKRIEELAPPGPASRLLPDLVVRWRVSPSAGATAVHSPRFGTVTRRGIGSGRSGNHTGGAWAFLAPGASRLRNPGRPANIVDVAATAAALLEADADGLAGEALLEPSTASR